MAKTKATPTEKYWKKRQEELEKKWDKKSREEIERELRAYYEQALTHIEKDISALYQRFATDNGMDMAAAQQLLTGKEYRVWRMDIAEYVKEINATGNQELLRELNTLAMRSRITRLDALRAGTLKEMALLSEKSEKAMKEFLKSGYEDFYYHGLYEIGKKSGLQGAVSLVDGEKLERVLRVPWSGKNYSKRIWSNGAKLAKTIQQNIIAAAHRGVSVQEMTRVIRQKMGVGTKEAVRLVRTELNYVQNQAALHSIKDAGMKYYRFIATLDKRTSTVCQSHDGDVFPVEEAMPGKNMPPLHPHCRSVISGCLKGEYRPQSGTRIARDENGKNVLVPANMKYDDWRAVYLDKKLTLEEWEAGNVALQATNATGGLNAGAQSGKIEVKINASVATHLENILGKDVGAEVVDRLNNAPEVVRQVYNKYGERLNVLETDTQRTPCYVPLEQGVRLNLKKNTVDRMHLYEKGHKIKVAYDTIFHEFGHHISGLWVKDQNLFMLRDIAIEWRSAEGKTLDMLLREEAAEVIKARKNLLAQTVSRPTLADAKRSLTKELCAKQGYAIGDVSDMFGGCTKNTVVDHLKHDTSYWRNIDPGVEAFAEMFSATINNPDSLKEIKHYFPKTYEMFLEILEDIKG
nr:MAG TPA: minor capsid protein [Caudoviricetes sp.]